MEYDIASLVDQLADWTLIVKKSRAGREKVQGCDLQRIYSHLKKIGHGANRFPQNPNGDKKCKNCSKLGNLEENCC